LSKKISKSNVTFTQMLHNMYTNKKKLADHKIRLLHIKLRTYIQIQFYFYYFQFIPLKFILSLHSLINLCIRLKGKREIQIKNPGNPNENLGKPNKKTN
jgi:hypothetical protein